MEVGPRTMARRRRSGYGLLTRIGSTVVALGISVGAVACGGGADTGKADGAAAVTIKHSFGETKIDGSPKRVVALGNQWLDAVQSLGVQPVGYLDNTMGVTGGTAPWEPAALKRSTALNLNGDIVEQIAALEPDLILVPGYQVDKTMYEKLSRLAPTIGPVTPGAQIDNWSDEVTALGTVFGKRADADKVIAGVRDRISGAAQRHPGLSGKTFLTCMLTAPTQLMVLADPKDGSAELFNRLGLRIPEHIAKEAPLGGRLALSPERLADLDANLLVCGAMPGLAEKLTQLPGYAELPSVRAGSFAAVDVMTISAINSPTALSVPYLLDKLEPALAAAG
ncbi:MULTISPECIES: ABC transporter substrate-binding protein [unclassified Nocardia]|uniref:ABC transporter substrate-binding protein n=1 Tax=unclassified Nocardia TaxID=2637762 RepID=UPI001CE41A37|nr:MULTISPECIES: ABC transporter substrate-binding protein [unclassified Nocardia]